MKITFSSVFETDFAVIITHFAATVSPEHALRFENRAGWCRFVIDTFTAWLAEEAGDEGPGAHRQWAGNSPQSHSGFRAQPPGGFICQWPAGLLQ
jgi:hypothetical protein